MYEVVVTISIGLWRYRQDDLVRVEGFFHKAPIVSKGLMPRV